MRLAMIHFQASLPFDKIQSNESSTNWVKTNKRPSPLSSTCCSSLSHIFDKIVTWPLDWTLQLPYHTHTHTFLELLNPPSLSLNISVVVPYCLHCMNFTAWHLCVCERVGFLTWLMSFDSQSAFFPIHSLPSSYFCLCQCIQDSFHPSKSLSSFFHPFQHLFGPFLDCHSLDMSMHAVLILYNPEQNSVNMLFL